MRLCGVYSRRLLSTPVPTIIAVLTIPSPPTLYSRPLCFFGICGCPVTLVLAWLSLMPFCFPSFCLPWVRIHSLLALFMSMALSSPSCPFRASSLLSKLLIFTAIAGLLSCLPLLLALASISLPLFVFQVRAHALTCQPPFQRYVASFRSFFFLFFFLWSGSVFSIPFIS